MALMLRLLVITTILIAASFADAGVSSNNTKNVGFIAKIQRSNGQLTKTEQLQMAVEQGQQRMMKIMLDHFPGVETESSSHGDRLIKSHIQQWSGGFFMNLSIGTPAQPQFSALIDTGSDLIWTQCNTSSFNQSTPVFNPKKSSSYSEVKCKNHMCKVFPSNWSGCGNHTECVYTYGYADNTYIRGVLATETFTFEGNVSVSNLDFGCEFNNTGPDSEELGGIVGLGRGPLSLVSQMKYPNFTYCLPTFGTDETGLLSVGTSQLPAALQGAKTTPLLKNPFASTFYYLSLEGISIGHTQLNINKTKLKLNKTSGRGGFIIDSGTTVTCLEKSTFNQVKKELTNQLKLPSFNTSGTDIPLDLCYNITRPVHNIVFPNIIFQFKGRANFEIIPDNYFLLFADDNHTVGCLMMKSTFYADGTSIFGNFQQQNALVGYDLGKNKLSFITNTNCATAN